MLCDNTKNLECQKYLDMYKNNLEQIQELENTNKAILYYLQDIINTNRKLQFPLDLLNMNNNKNNKKTVDLYLKQYFKPLKINYKLCKDWLIKSINNSQCWIRFQIDNKKYQLSIPMDIDLDKSERNNYGKFELCYEEKRNYSKLIQTDYNLENIFKELKTFIEKI